MFHSEQINVTEKRAVLHVARCAPKTERIIVDGVGVISEVHAVLERMAEFSRQVRGEEWRGTPKSASAMSSTSGSAASTSPP